MSHITPGGKERQITSVTDHGDGTYGVTYMLSEAGVHKLHVKLAGEPIKGSPFDVTVLRSAVHGGACYLHEVPKTMNAFQWHSCELLSCDRFGNRVHGGGAVVSVSVCERFGMQPAEFRIHDEGTGIYRIELRPLLLTGLFQMSIAVDGKEVKGSPFSVEVLPSGLLHAVRPDVDGEVVVWRVAKLRVLVDESVIDPRFIPIEDIHCTIFGPGQSRAQAQQTRQPFGFEIAFTPQRAGETSIRVQLCELELPGSPFTLSVLPAPVASVPG